MLNIKLISTEEAMLQKGKLHIPLEWDSWMLIAKGDLNNKKNHNRAYDFISSKLYSYNFDRIF